MAKRLMVSLLAILVSLAWYATAAPAPEGMRLVIDTDKRTLTVLVDGRPTRTLPCAVGKSLTRTPVGEWTVVDKSTNWGGGFGTRWLGLNVPWGIYGIHGTNKPSSIGTAASAGCIRLQNRDVEWLYSVVKIGTRVTIVGARQRVTVERPLRRGQTGKEVLELQFALRQAGFHIDPVDGRFGSQTEQVVKAVQARYDLPQTGRADRNVLALLGLLPATTGR
ncbi:MAG: L,D-transpeptidase family protein [Selenomonadales bacterium]|nr:L,D-transpeptidase family protein [Selenomonadales bacterium]